MDLLAEEVSVKEKYNRLIIEHMMRAEQLKAERERIEDLKKKGWEIDDFILSSDGYEITIKKGSKEARYIGKTPDKALIQAAKKAV